MKFLALPVRNLARHRIRSILTAAGIAIAVGGMIALVGLSQGLEHSWVMWLQDKGTHILALQKGSVDMLSASLDESLAARIAEQPGVAEALGGLGELVELDSGQMAYVAGRPLEGDYWTSLNLVAGTIPTAAAPEAVVLGEALAQQIAKGPGDTIQLSGTDFRIAGIVKQGNVLDDRSVILAMPVMQRLLGREGKVTGFHIRVQNPNDPAGLAAVNSRLAAAFPTLSFTESSEFGKNTQVTKMLRGMAWASSTIAMGMAFVAVMNTLLMSVMERTREIGLFSAIGWSSSRVVKMVVLDGLILSTLGAGGGIVLGLAALRWVSGHPKLGALFQPEVTAWVLVEGAGAAMLLGVLGGLYPAWRATRVNPMTLLRGE
jgi:putative ABC transport system permease protein